MLKYLTRRLYHNKIYTDEPEIFYKWYKWCCGLPVLLRLRPIFFSGIFLLIGLILLITPYTRFIALFFIFSTDFYLLYSIIQIKKDRKYRILHMNSPFKIRTLKLYEFILRHFVTKKGKALIKSDWKKIRKECRELYDNLLCNECNHYCYSYSLDIGKIIKDVTLMWCAIKDPFEKNLYYAHAVVMKNGEIYDSNLRLCVDFEEYKKLYNLKIYKTWNYDEYSKENFRESERMEFRNWCEENNVSAYLKF